MAAYRSLLYVPGNRRDLIAKIERYEADGYILDLEDGVPAAERTRARELLTEVVPPLSKSGRVIHVRVNPVHSDGHRQDIETALSIGVSHLHVPKVSSAADIASADHFVFELATRWRLDLEEIRIFPSLETSRALLAASEICAASPRIAGLVLGADDLTAEWGATRTPEGRELDYVRQQLVIVACAYGVVPIDATYPYHKDLDGCARDAAHARALGFRGKQAIHPAQCPIINQAFTPSADELAEARAIVEAAETARARGHGTATAAGTQIDAAVEKRARQLLAQFGTDDA